MGRLEKAFFRSKTVYTCFFGRIRIIRIRGPKFLYRQER